MPYYHSSFIWLKKLISKLELFTLIVRAYSIITYYFTFSKVRNQIRNICLSFILSRTGQKRIPPFYLSTTENLNNPNLNGIESKRVGQQKSVISISASGSGDTYLTKVIPAPYKTRTHSGNHYLPISLLP